MARVHNIFHRCKTSRFVRQRDTYRGTLLVDMLRWLKNEVGGKQPRVTSKIIVNFRPIIMRRACISDQVSKKIIICMTIVFKSSWLISFTHVRVPLHAWKLLFSRRCHRHIFKRVSVVVSNYVSDYAFRYPQIFPRSPQVWRDYPSYSSLQGRLDPLMSRGYETLIINALNEVSWSIRDNFRKRRDN